MLLAVLLMFLVTEFPQAILGLLSAVIGEKFEMECYVSLGNSFDVPKLSQFTIMDELKKPVKIPLHASLALTTLLASLKAEIPESFAFASRFVSISMRIRQLTCGNVLFFLLLGDSQLVHIKFCSI